MLVSSEQAEGLRTLADVRRDIRSGWSAQLWAQLVEKVDREMREPPIAAREQNRDYPLVARTCNRIMDAALVALVTDDRRYADAALAQIQVLFDQQQWPDWADKAHLEVGLNSDLRHGQFARAIGLAYDWLYNLLTPQQRLQIVAGLDRCAIKRFKASVEAKESWVTRQSNWKTSVVGGFGMLGMALGPDHPDSIWLQELARPLMDSYMTVFGPQGEFNESPQYAGSTMYVVSYYLAQYYATRGKLQPRQLDQLRDFGHWFLYCILPPGRMIDFGDGYPENPPNVFHFAAVAAALRDPTLQWMYEQYVDVAENNNHRRRAQELLFFDPTLKSRPPDHRVPLGRSFPAQAGIVVSRSSWSPAGPESLVYSKARTEDVHQHADWGQVCLDGFGERLLVDLGSPPVYPRRDKEQYYNYQQDGHNVLVIGDDETEINWRSWPEGRTVWSEFDDAQGGAWSFDLSDVYGPERQVRRHVIHLLPRVLVVLDDAQLPSSQRIRLRWHTSTPAQLDETGRFTVRRNGVALASQVTSLEGEAKPRLGRHEYLPPYDKGRLGNPYPQRHEPFVELQTESNRFRSLSLFCVTGPRETVHSWEGGIDSWQIQTPEGTVRVGLQKDALTASNADLRRRWRIELKAGP